MKAKLAHYQNLWKLEEVQKLTSTETSDLYLVSSPHGPAVLKLLNEFGQKHEAVSAVFLRACEGLGAARLFEWDQEAHLIERLYGDNLYQFSKRGEEEKASEEFVAIIKKIHKVSSSELNIPNFKELFNAYERVSIPEEIHDLINLAREKVAELLKSQDQEVLLHGDLHHENIMARSNGEFVCFDSQAWIGDPAYELGTTLKNPWDYPAVSHDAEVFQQRAAFFSKELELPLERIIGYAFVHCCLSICWGIEDKQPYDHSLAVAKMILPLLK